MILYVNGDSHSHGMHLNPHEKFSDIVAKEIGFNVVNAAQVGASNTSILRTTREYLASGETPDLILIGWTTWEREEWHYQNQYYNINTSGHDQLPKELQAHTRLSWVSKNELRLPCLEDNAFNKAEQETNRYTYLFVTKVAIPNGTNMAPGTSKTPKLLLTGSGEGNLIDFSKALNIEVPKTKNNK